LAMKVAIFYYVNIGNTIGAEKLEEP
jgi:hypothetical protein